MFGNPEADLAGLRCGAMGLFRRKATKPDGFLVSGHVSVWLVGTDRYPDAYRDAKDDQPVYVELRAERDNPYDANAIAGLVDGRVAGYLPKEVAAKYRAPIEAAAALGFRLFVATEFSKRYRGRRQDWSWVDRPPAAGCTRELVGASIRPTRERLRLPDDRLS